MPKYPTFPDCFDECKQVTIGSLKQLGFLSPDATIRGSYRWTRGGNPSGAINISVSLLERYAGLDYLSNGKPVNYRVQLERIPAHFGGYNWYFICPATGKRCRTLYGIGGLFLSRFAYPSAMYSTQTESKRYRDFSKMFGVLDLRNEYLNKRHSRTTYKGKLTKRYRRILDKESRFNPNAIRQFLNR
jgi:hypothetical protein